MVQRWKAATSAQRHGPPSRPIYPSGHWQQGGPNPGVPRALVAFRQISLWHFAFEVHCLCAHGITNLLSISWLRTCMCIYIYIVQIFLTCVKSLYKSRVNTAHQHITEPKRHGKTWNILKHTRCPVRKWPLSGCWYPGSLRPSRHGWPKSQLGAPRVSHDPVSASEKIELGSTLAILMSRKWTSRI